MKKKLILTSILLSISVLAFQTSPYARRIRPFASTPSSCQENEIGYNMTNHTILICTNSGYQALTTGGSGSFAPIGAKYIVQVADATLTNEQALGALSTGILKNTTTTGILSIAVASDFPAGSGLPSQTGNNGKYLTTNGTISSWNTISSGITNSAPEGTIPTTDGSGNLIASEITNNGRTIISTDEFNLQPIDSIGNGFEVDISGGNAANGFNGGNVVIDGGGEIDGGGSGSITVGGAGGGDGGTISINAGLGDTSGEIDFTTFEDGGSTAIASILNGYRFKLGVPLLVFKTDVSLSSSGGFLTVRNAGNSANANFLAADITATGAIANAAFSVDTFGNISATADATSGDMTFNSANVSLFGNIKINKTITAGGTAGAQTINKSSGSVNFAAAATSLVVTNSLVSTNSIIQCTVATNDTTLKSTQCVAASGSFTVFANAAATAETRVNFTVTN